MPLNLKVNNTIRTLDVAPDTPLLWALRDVLDLKGAKYGCGKGLCGACTVLINGRPVRSCMTPVSAAVGDVIVTVEGLSPDGKHPVQIAWERADVAQCGYCQSGQIMSAVALLNRVPNPTDEQIETAMSSNLCRCGTYPRIRQAVQMAAKAGHLAPTTQKK